MGANKRNDQQIADDKIFIAKLWLKAVPYRSIAEQVNEHNKSEGKDYEISYSQVAYDIKAIMEEWREERLDLVDLYIDRELKKLDQIERECWVAWENSKKGKKSIKLDGGDIGTDIRDITGGTIKEQSLEESVGDPRFFDKIMACMEKRKDLIGYGQPKKVEFSGSVAVGVSTMTEEDMEKEAKRIRNNMKKTNDAGGENTTG